MGIVRAGDFRSGCPIIEPHVYGTPVNDPEPFGNVEPQSNTTLDSNPVTWVPAPSHFGNKTGFSLQVVPPIIIVAQGSAGTTAINVTLLGGFTSTITLTYSGAPVGVTIAFAPSSTSTTSTATVTVGSSVAIGKYTITVTGTAASGEVETTNIHLVVII
jgi:hypothetical protein